MSLKENVVRVVEHASVEDRTPAAAAAVAE